MNSCTAPARLIVRKRNARRGSIYLVVLVTVATVTTMILLGITLRKSTNAGYRASNDSRAAQVGARSAAEAALVQLQRSQSEFLTNAKSGIILPMTTLGNAEVGVIASDKNTGGAVTDSTEIIEVVAGGQVGDARSLLGFDVQASSAGVYIEYLQALNAGSYWALDEDTGTGVATDSIGGNHGLYADASNAGLEQFLDGQLAPSISSPESTVTIEHQSSFEAEEGAIVLWARVQDSTLREQQGLVSKESAESPELHFAMYIENRQLKVEINSQSGAFSKTLRSSAEQFMDADWHHVAYTFGQSGARLFIDGVRVQYVPAFTVGLSYNVGKSSETNSESWTIGGRHTGLTADFPLEGSVARFAFFPVQLADSNIAKLMEAQLDATKLVAVEGSFVRVVE